MCILAGGPEAVNARYDVVGFDHSGRCCLSIGESLDLQAAVSRMRGFNSDGSGRLVAGVVPHGACPIAEAEAEPAEGDLLLPHRLAEENFTGAVDNESWECRTLLSWFLQFFDGDLDVYSRLEGAVLAIIADMGGSPPADDEEYGLAVQGERLTPRQMAVAWRRMLGAAA